MRLRSLCSLYRVVEFACPAIFVTALLAMAPGCVVYEPVPWDTLLVRAGLLIEG
ncbi:MAG TPA: hypothetical protein VJ864_00290 [Candidatus Binatia bacterium]|nr:hypothetical protein [Candidatus Binatia bacterium]